MKYRLVYFTGYALWIARVLFGLTFVSNTLNIPHLAFDEGDNENENSNAMIELERKGLFLLQYRHRKEVQFERKYPKRFLSSVVQPCKLAVISQSQIVTTSYRFSPLVLARLLGQCDTVFQSKISRSALGILLTNSYE